MEAILDTSCIIDLWRGYAPAVAWFRAHPNARYGATPVVWLEVLSGAKDKLEQNRLQKLLRLFETVHLTADDQEWAVNNLVRYRLSHAVDEFDCLIAAPAARMNLTLYTRNLKHFTLMLGPLAQQPYS